MSTDKRTPVIDATLANAIADFLASKGIDSVHSSVLDNFEAGYILIDDPDPIIVPHAYEADASKPYYFNGRGAKCLHCACDPISDVHHGGRQVYQSAHHVIARLGIFGELPKFWTIDVSNVMSDRATAAYRTKLEGEVALFETTPAIASFLRTAFADNVRGFTSPAKADLTWLVDIAKADTKYKPAYKPEAGCTASLNLRNAVRYASTQEAYADHSFYAVPVTIAAGADMAVCARNLASFANACRTATGVAGYGSTWTATLHTNDAGTFAVLESRSSIAD